MRYMKKFNGCMKKHLNKKIQNYFLQFLFFISIISELIFFYFKTKLIFYVNLYESFFIQDTSID